MPVRLLHISDLHIHGDDSADKAIALALARLAEAYPKHHLVVTGDIVDDGQEAQLHAALRYLSPFAGRISICPGNHDFGRLGNFFEPAAARRFDALLAEPLGQQVSFSGAGGPAVSVLVDEEDPAHRVLLIGLDSTLETVDLSDFARGEVGAETLAEVEGLLTSEAALDMARVVFLHHHPFLDHDPFMALGDAEALLETLSGRVDALLFGHAHHADHWRDRHGIAHLLCADTLRSASWVWELVIERVERDGGVESEIQVRRAPLEGHGADP